MIIEVTVGPKPARVARTPNTRSSTPLPLMTNATPRSSRILALSTVEFTAPTLELRPSETLSNRGEDLAENRRVVVARGGRGGRRLHLGVDTGGTFTDAAVLDAVTHEVLATAKSLTTKDDLAIGVGRAIKAAAEGLPDGLGAADIALVSVSTTLATNAVVEGHGDAVAAIFIGFDDDMVERTGVARGFPDVQILRIRGGHDHSGREREPLDEDALRQAIETIDDAVRALAICSAFAVRNPDHEHRAREIVESMTAMPVTISGELSSGLDAPRRALTSVLNARLIGRADALIRSVQRAMDEIDLDVPLMLVKGDGTRALASAVARRPIETVLSGPAASMVGATWLSEVSDFVLSDIGGTTTDVGVVVDGRMLISAEGASVGGWRTMVRAGDLRTVGLGGDSDVSLNGRHVVVGPQRVVPLSLLASRVPRVVELLEADLADERTGGASHGRFLLTPSSVSLGGEPSPSTEGSLTESECALIDRLSGGPRPWRSIIGSAREGRLVDGLRRRGLLQVSAFTPTDAAHVLGRQTTFDADAALLGATLLARLRDMASPTQDRIHSLAQEVWDETVRASARIVIDTALTHGDNPFHASGANDGQLIDSVCRGDASRGLVRLQMTPHVPIVAVGGPAPVFYDEVARRLGTSVIYPPHWAVANAVGAATGVVSRIVTVTVEATGDGYWGIHSSDGRDVATNPTEALDRATKTAEELAWAELEAIGAGEPVVTVRIEKIHLPGFDKSGDLGLLSARITAEAVAAPSV